MHIEKSLFTKITLMHKLGSFLGLQDCRMANVYLEKNMDITVLEKYDTVTLQLPVV